MLSSFAHNNAGVHADAASVFGSATSSVSDPAPNTRSYAE